MHDPEGALHAQDRLLALQRGAACFADIPWAYPLDGAHFTDRIPAPQPEERASLNYV